MAYPSKFFNIKNDKNLIISKINYDKNEIMYEKENKIDKGSFGKIYWW